MDTSRQDPEGIAAKSGSSSTVSRQRRSIAEKRRIVEETYRSHRISPPEHLRFDLTGTGRAALRTRLQNQSKLFAHFVQSWHLPRDGACIWVANPKRRDEASSKRRHKPRHFSRGCNPVGRSLSPMSRLLPRLRVHTLGSRVEAGRTGPFRFGMGSADVWCSVVGELTTGGSRRSIGRQS
jgi:hypothetical protein